MSKQKEATETAMTPWKDNKVLVKTSSDHMPDFMQSDAGAGTEGMKGITSPPRIKVIQSQKSSNYSAFDDGDVIITPVNVVVAKAGQPFWFVPLLFYPEYCTINPLQMKGQLDMVRARTLDVNSTIAMKSRDKDLRNADVCPENNKFTLSHVEYYTFICVIIGSENVPPSMPVAMSFSGAEHKIGSQLTSLLRLKHPAPIYGCVMEAVVPKTKRENTKGSWYGINVSNPSSDGAPSPWVRDPDEYKTLKELHEMLRAQLEADLLRVDRESDEADKDGVDVSEAAKSI